MPNITYVALSNFERGLKTPLTVSKVPSAATWRAPGLQGKVQKGGQVLEKILFQRVPSRRTGGVGNEQSQILVQIPTTIQQFLSSLRIGFPEAGCHGN